MLKIYTQNARCKKRRTPRAIAALVLGIFTLSLLLPAPMSASSWNPTLLVNTEAFQIVHEGDSAAGTDVELRFGDTLSEKLYWDRTNSEFRFSDDLRVDGNITSSGSIVVNSASRIKANLNVAGTVSGAVLYASSGINSSGAVIIKTPVTTSATLGGTGALVVMQRIELGTGAYMSASGAAILALDSPVQSAGLNGQASTTPHIVFGYRGAFDTNLYRLTGSTLATDDALAVGGNVGIGASQPTTKLEIVGTASGDHIHAQSTLTSSGTLTVSGNVKTKGDLTINSDNGAANAVLTFGNDDTAQTLTFIDAAQKFSFSKDMRVLGNLSGSTLNVDGNAGIYGQMTVSGATTLKSTLKIGGVTYTFPTSDGSASGKVLKTNSAGQLSWSSDTGGNTAGQGITIANSVISLSSSFSGTSLEITSTASGDHVHAQNLLTSSGTVRVSSGITLNEDLGATDVGIVFGSDTASENLSWVNLPDRFEFSDDLHTTGNITSSGTLTINSATTLKSTLKIGGVTYTFPTSDGSASGKVLATDSAGTLAWTTAAGPAVTGSISQTSHGFSVGDVLRYTGTKYATAKANAADNAEVVGIVSKVADANTFTLLTSGKITGLSGLTAGSVYFLSASSSGALTATQPTMPNVSKPLLIADSATSGYFSNMRGIIGAGTTLTGSVLRVMSGANSYVLGNTGIGTATPETKLEVVGAISGSSLQVTGSITMSGTIFNALPLSTVEGRLTLTSGTAVTTSDVTGATTIYFTPYEGDRIYLYDGTRWKLYSFSELSLALGTLTNALPYDVFLYDNAGTLTLESLAWTNGTTRATALTTQNGVLVKSGATTRRYLGTFYTTSTTTTEDSAAKRLLFNYYNRAPRTLLKTESTNSWTYDSTTWRSLNNSTANRVEIVVGVAEVMLELDAVAHVTPGGGSWASIGIDEDNTNANDADLVQVGYADSFPPIRALLKKYPAVGYHYYQITEACGSAVTSTFYSDYTVSGSPFRRSGVAGFLR